MAHFTKTKRTVVIKLEAVPGVAETLLDADFDIRFRTVELTKDIEMESDVKFLNGTDTEDADISGKRMGSVTTSFYLAQSGAAATAPNYFKALKACGCIQVPYTTTGIGIQPNKSAADTTATIWVIDETVGGTPVGIANKYVGCSGNPVFSADGTGKYYGCTATYTGKLVQPSDIDNTNLLSLTAADTTPPEKLLSNTVSVFGSSVCISSFSLDAGNEIVGKECQSDPTGFDYFYVNSRKPRLTLNPYSSQVAVRDPYALLTAETTGTIEIESALATPPLTISIPVAQLIAIGDGDLNGIVKSDETYKCLTNDGTSIAGLTNEEATWELLHYARA